MFNEVFAFAAEEACQLCCDVYSGGNKGDVA